MKTPIGLLPTLDAIDTNGLDVTDDDMEELLSVDLERLARGGAADRGSTTRSVRRAPPRASCAAELDELEKRLARAERREPRPATLRGMAVSAYILIQTEVGKAAQVAAGGAQRSTAWCRPRTSPAPTTSSPGPRPSTVDELGKMVVSRVQMIDGITRTLTCPVVNL